MKKYRMISRKALGLILALCLACGSLSAGAVVYAAEDPAQVVAAEGATATNGDTTDDTEEPAGDGTGTGDTGMPGGDSPVEHTGDEMAGGGDSGTGGGADTGDSTGGTEDDIPASDPGENPEGGTGNGTDTGDIAPVDGEELSNVEDAEGLTDEEFLVIEEEETVSMAAMNANVSGTIYASSLADNDSLVLTADTTLIVDADKTLKSISGNYALTIQGSKRLEIKSGGHGISVSSLELSLSNESSNGILVIDSKKDGLHVDGNVIVKSGRLFISVGKESSAIYSPKGNVVIYSGFLSFSGGTSSSGFFVEKGNIVVFGGTVYTECSYYGLFAKEGTVLVSGNVDVFGAFGIVGRNGIEITGGKTNIRAWCSLSSSQAGIKIQNAEVEVTNITGSSNPIAIFANTNITIDNATVTAKTNMSQAVDNDMIVSESGDIVIGSDATVTAPGIYCGIRASNGEIKIAGNVDATGWYAIWAKNGIQITGGKTKAEGPMAICTPAMLTIQNAEIEAKGWDNPGGAALCGENGIVISNGTVTAIAAPGRDAIISGSGQITLNGMISASGGKKGITASGNIVIEGGSVNAQGSGSAVYSNAGTITMKFPLAITTPDGGRISGNTIVGTDGKTAKEAVIQNRPLPSNCTVFIANGAGAYEGDKLTLKYSSNFPPNRSVQWQRHVSESTWMDIPGATQETYVAKAADKGKAIRARVSAAGYSGEKITTNHCTILVNPTLGGSVTYDRPATVGVDMTATATLTPAGISENEIYYDWQVSDDGLSGWKSISGAYGKTYKPALEYLEKYIRVVVTARGTIGKVMGTARKVAKQANSSEPVKPQLMVNPPSYGTITVTNARADQEYVVIPAGEDEAPNPDWNNSDYPASNGTLSLTTAKDTHVVVFTRMRETDIRNAGRKVSNTRVYNGDVPDLQGISLSIKEIKGSVESNVDQDEFGRYYVMEGDVYKITISPIPSNAEFDGVRGAELQIANTNSSIYGAYYSSPECTSRIALGTYYKTVYYKPTEERTALGVKLSAKKRSVSDTISLVQGNIQDGYITNAIGVTEDVIIRQGETQSGYSYMVRPGKATPELTATLHDGAGTAPVITFDRINHTFTVNATSASTGQFVYLFKATSGASSYVTVTVEAGKGTITITPGSGTGTVQTNEVTKGTEYILPDPKDIGFSHANTWWVFDGWEVDGEIKDAGDGIVITENITITAQWKDHDHVMMRVPGFEPTCTWTGNKEHWRCDVCGRMFADEAAQLEASSPNVFKIPATGHTPGPVVRENEIPVDEFHDGSYDEVTYCTACHEELSRTHGVVERRILQTVSFNAGSIDDFKLTGGSVSLNWDVNDVADTRYHADQEAILYLEEECAATSAPVVTSEQMDNETCYAKYTIRNNTAGDRSLVFSKLEKANCRLTVSGYNTECRSVTPYVAAGESRVDIVFQLKKKQEYAVKATPETVKMGAEVVWDGTNMSYMTPSEQDIMLHNEGSEQVIFEPLNMSTHPAETSANVILTGQDALVFEIKAAGSDPYPRTIAPGGENPVCAVHVKTGAKLEPNRVYTAQLKLKTKEGAESVVSIALHAYASERTGIWMEEIPAQDYTSKKITPEVKVYWGETLLTNADYSVSYKNNVNAYTLTEGQEGFSAAKAPTITIKGKGNYKGTFTRAFVINQANLTTQATAENVKLTYNKKVQKPVTTVTAMLGGVSVKLKAGKDFVYEYPDSGCKNPGLYTVTIRPKSENFKGQQEFRAQIIDGVPMSKVTVAKIKDVKYDGSPQTPALTLKYGKETLVQGIDYTVSYENNLDAGTATVTIKGTELTASGSKTYFGTVKKTFKITGTSIAGAKFETVPELWHKSFDYDGTAKKQAPASYRLTLNKGTVVIPAYGYAVSYEKNTNPGTAKIIFTGRPERGYTGKLVKTFTIAGYDIKTDIYNRIAVNYESSLWQDNEATMPSLPYQAGGVKPEPVVKFLGEPLVKGRDYTVSFSNNTAVKTDLSDGKKIPTVTIKGKGYFKGTITRQFKITQQDFASAVTVIASDVNWQNKAGLYRTKITVLEKSTGKVLKAGTDYGAVNDLSVAPIKFVYVEIPTGKSVVKKEGTPVAVTPDVTEVTPDDIIPAGTVIRVTVTGKGAYAGSTASATYRFVEKAVSITGSAFKITIPAQQWTEEAVELTAGDISVTQKVSRTETKVLTYGTDYEIVPGSYVNNVKRGTAKVTVRGKGAYGGTKQVSFKIVQRRMHYEIAYDKNEAALRKLLWEKLTAEEQAVATTAYGNQEKWFAANYRITGTMKKTATPYAGALSAGKYRLQRYNTKAKKWTKVPATEVSFLGWARESEGSKLFDNKAPFKPSWFLRLTYDDSVTLYAVWGSP